VCGVWRRHAYNAIQSRAGLLKRNLRKEEGEEEKKKENTEKEKRERYWVGGKGLDWMGMLCIIYIGKFWDASDGNWKTIDRFGLRYDHGRVGLLSLSAYDCALCLSNRFSSVQHPVHKEPNSFVCAIKEVIHVKDIVRRISL